MADTEQTITGESPNDRVAVILPDGRAGTVLRSDLGNMPEGTQLETPEGTQARAESQAQVGRGAQTFIESFADTATFGGTSALARAVAPEAAQQMRQRREQNPGAALGGALVGGLSPGGAGGLIGKAGAAVGELAAGTKVIRGLAAGGKAGQAIARYAPAIAQGATEGALFGAGSGLSNQMLSKDPISAESVLSEMTSQAFLGGAIGVGAGLGGALLSDAAAAARVHVKRLTTPTIADDVLALPEAASIGEDVQFLAKGPQKGATRGLRAEQRALESEAQGLVGQFDSAGANAGEHAAKPMTFPEFMKGKMGPAMKEHGGHAGAMKALSAQYQEYKAAFAAGNLEGGAVEGLQARQQVIDDFKAKYHRMDTASRQNIRQMEGLQRKGVEVSPELLQAADDLEKARRATREWLPLEKERSYEVVDEGPRGGYANKQGKSMQSWTGSDTDIVKAVQQPGFRDALAAHQEALDHMQALLGNKAYPPVVGEHGIFGVAESHAPAMRDPALAARMEDVARKWDTLEAAIAKQSQPARVSEFVKLAESKGMVVGDDALNAAIKEAGLDGIAASDLPPAELDRLKATIYQQQAKDYIAMVRAEDKAALARAKTAKPSEPPKKKGALAKLLGESIAEKAATGAGAALGGAIGGYPGAVAGGWLGKTFLGGPLARVSKELSGRVGGKVQSLAKGVDAFLGVAEKVAPKTVKLTNGIFKTASFAMDKPEESPAGEPIKQQKTPSKNPYDMRVAEMGRVLGDPAAARQKIHDSLAGVRMADPLLADQMEDLAFRRLMFLGDKMPKNPGLGQLIGKQTKYQPSDAEQAKWARYIDAAENPAGIMDDLASGRLSVEAVETMKELYPATYDRVKQDIVTRAGELQSELTWEQRLSLTTLFGVPTDAVLRPSSILTFQSTYIPTAEDQGTAGSPPTGQMKPPAATPAQQMASPTV